MQPARGHAAVALISALGAILALAAVVIGGQLRSPEMLLAVVLFANALVRFQLARR